MWAKALDPVRGIDHAMTLPMTRLLLDICHTVLLKSFPKGLLARNGTPLSMPFLANRAAVFFLQPIPWRYLMRMSLAIATAKIVAVHRGPRNVIGGNSFRAG